MLMPDKPKLLLVEDDPNIRFLAGLSLERYYEVQLAESGQQALDICQHLTPDVILLDIQLPGMNGIEVLTKLREKSEFKDITIIFITASVQTQEIAKYEQYAVQGIIRKPFDPMSLSAEIEKIREGPKKNPI